MNIVGFERKLKIYILSAVMLIIFCFTLTGCALFGSKSQEAAKSETTLWHSREQSVRIVPQDTPKGVASIPNDHPVQLASDQLRLALKTLEVSLEDSSDPVPVFTEAELDTLAGRLSEGLSKAGPGEDVTFVVIGQRKALYGLAKQRKVTTGRVFYRDGRLNVIFGRMIEDIREYVDLRAFPLTPGARAKSLERSWKLEETPDMNFYGDGGMYRTDWAVLDLASIAAHEALGTRPAKISREQRDERAVPARRTGTGNGSQVQAPVDSVDAGQRYGKTDKSIEERLTILNDLKNKKLITEDEYQAKRADILKDL